MNKIPVLLTCMLLVNVISFAQDKDEMSIRGVMQEQTTAWNKGDLTSFMKTYWNSDSLMFIGRNGVTYGWQKTLANYKKNYPDTTAMGKLRFELVDVKRLSEVYFFVIGKWFLARSIGNLNGVFTLLFRSNNGKWVIVGDHSSSALSP